MQFWKSSGFRSIPEGWQFLFPNYSSTQRVPMYSDTVQGQNAVWKNRTTFGQCSAELETVQLALKHFIPHLRGRCVLVWLDTILTISQINHQGSARLLKVTWDLLTCVTHFSLWFFWKEVAGSLRQDVLMHKWPGILIPGMLLRVFKGATGHFWWPLYGQDDQGYVPSTGSVAGFSWCWRLCACHPLSRDSKDGCQQDCLPPGHQLV